MTTQTQTPGPTFSMTRANEITKRSGVDGATCIRYLEGRALGWGDMEIVRHLRETYDWSMMDTVRVVRLLKATERQLDEEQADSEGKYWTMFGACHTDAFGKTHAFILLLQGMLPSEEIDRWEGAVQTQHPDAFIYAGPNVLLGSKHDVVASATRMLNCDSYKINTVTKPGS